MVLKRTNPGPDYTLRWPRPLFVREARVLAGEPDSADLRGEIKLLLEEAFVSDQPQRDFDQTSQPTSPWDVVETTSRLGAAALGRGRNQQHLDDLIAASSRMPEEAAPRPYYTQRQNPGAAPTPSPTPRIRDAKHAWSTTVLSLLDRGYFDRAASRPCVDDPGNDDELTQVNTLNWAFVQRLSGFGPWDKVPEAWPDPHFFAMIEVGHDLVARPRRRWFHDYNRCGWHYSDFAVDPAQILYRWTVNRLLARHGIDLQLAKAGEDVGRLVHAPADGREELVAAAVGRPGSEGDKVRHAVTLFRSRTADVESKRSACIALAGVLEGRRPLIKAELLSKDEGALFRIANEFAIRHQDAKQHADYDGAYLEWLYWWYLATVELTNRLIDRQPMKP